MKRLRTTMAIGATLSLAIGAAATTVAQDGEAVLVSGGEYFFEGIPAELPTGSDLTFTNAGEEFHELAVARIADDVTMSTEELLAMGDAALEEGLVIVTGQVFAAPGEDGMGQIDLDLPGRYVAVCFIPQGVTDPSLLEFMGPGMDPADAPEDVQAILANPPHVALGMIAEFEVVGEPMVDAMDDADDMSDDMDDAGDMDDTDDMEDAEDDG